MTEARRDHPLTPEDLGAALRASAPDGAAAVAREVVHLAEVGARRRALRDDLAVLVVALDATPARLDLPAALGRGARGLERALELAQGAGQRGRELVAGIGQAHACGSCGGPARRRARARGAGRSG